MRIHIHICACIVVSFLNEGDTKLCAQTLVPYVYVREADVMWSKRIWRVIDLREKINLPFYYPLDDLPDRKSLFRIIQTGINEGKILGVFEYDAFTNEFGAPLKSTEAKTRLTETIDVKDSVGSPLLDPLGNQVTMQESIKPERVVQYWIKEDWFFEKQRSVMEVRIIGIAPVIEIDDPVNGRYSYKPLFWLYYPGCRNYFSEFKSYNPYNDADWRNFDEIFHKRIFSSYIRQESNVYNRPITAYALGEEALFESGRIKEAIFKFEEDLWHY